MSDAGRPTVPRLVVGGLALLAVLAAVNVFHLRHAFAYSVALLLVASAAVITVAVLVTRRWRRAGAIVLGVLVLLGWGYAILVVRALTGGGDTMSEDAGPPPSVRFVDDPDTTTVEVLRADGCSYRSAVSPGTLAIVPVNRPPVPGSC